MKKVVFTAMFMLIILTLCACGGKRNDTKTLGLDSNLYTQEEITAAIDVIKKEFQEEWSGCILTEICYAGDKVSQEHQDWADRNGADEVIVLLSSFDVDSSGGDGSLNPNSTYTNWMWILVRTDKGPWKHVDHGY